MERDILHAPKKWAYLVAVGPISIAFGLLAIVYMLAGAVAGVPLPGGPELLIIWFALNAAALPAVVLGVWLDVPVVRRETGVGQRRWVWAVAALVLAPLVGSVYLWHRRSWFEGAA